MRGVTRTQSRSASKVSVDYRPSFDTASKRLKTTVSRSMSAQVSLMLVRLATEPLSAISLLELVPNEPSFNKVGTVLAAVCWLCSLLLRNVEVNQSPRKRRSSRRALAGNPCSWSEG